MRSRTRSRTKSVSQSQIVLEQIALLLTSFIWTTVILSILVFFWLYQDLEANWDQILNPSQSPPMGPQLALAIEMTATPSPTSSPSPSPSPSSSPEPEITPSPTPTETPSPTSTATPEPAPPDVLPETLNIDEATPVPIAPQTTDTPTPVPVAPVEPTATLEPIPVEPPPPAAEPTANPAAAGNAPTHILIPSVGIDSAIVPVGWQLVEQNGQQYSIWDVADYAVGWHNTSALPGQVGNLVMAGHHNIGGEVFRYLVNVEVGDEVVLYVGEQAYRYQIELKTIVKEKGEPADVRRRNAQWIAPTTDERITMVTCWPYTNNTHRVIVVAKPMGG